MASPKILIIEDEQDVIDLLTLHLRKAGFTLSTATDGAAGLRKAREESPALIILDLLLPKMPGLEICRALKTDIATRQIPILMLTAKAEEIDRIVGLEFGADDYVTKPFSPRELVLRLKKVVDRSDHSRSITPPRDRGRQTAAADQRRIQIAEHADAPAGTRAGARPFAQ